MRKAVFCVVKDGLLHLKGHLSHGERWPFMLTPRTGCRGAAPCQPFMLSAASFLYMAGVMPFIFLKVRLKLTALVYPTSS